MNNLQNKKKTSEKLFRQLQIWRRAIHANPELGFEEKKTAALVAAVLKQNGWQVKTGVAKTGVVGLLGNKYAGKVMAIRADMDALPIQEEATHTYKSTVSNVMHACGHDGNTTIALGAACLLSQNKNRLNGQVKIIFQPCEEMPPGGAKAMIKAGVLKAPVPQLMIAGHMDAQLPVGRIGLKENIVMANADAFTITVFGKGGHGAMPQKCIDPITVSAQIITNIQHIISRECDPLNSEVITIGEIRGGSAYNVIANSVQLKGTIRSLTKKERYYLPKQIKRIAEQVAKAHKAKAVFEFEEGHPVLINHPKATGLVKKAVAEELGAKALIEFKNPIMSGEDFTYYAQELPTCFFHVGGAFKTKANYPWHHPRFDFDEKGLVDGATVLARVVLDYLK